MRSGLALALSLGLLAQPLMAGNSLVLAGAPRLVAKSPLSITPASEWNKLGARPGRNAETWTLDGDALNDVTFYAAIGAEKTLFREVDKRNRPLPRISATMLASDIPGLLENSYRIALGTPLMAIDMIEPAPFAGRPGVRFTYHFTRQGDTVQRLGEGRGAMIGGQLYLVTYEAPALHYFARSLTAFRQLADSATLQATLPAS